MMEAHISSAPNPRRDCAIAIAPSPSLVCIDQQIWIQILITNHIPLEGRILIEVLSSSDQVVEVHEISETELRGRDGRKAWPIGPLSTPDRYTIRATVKDSGVFALAFVYVAKPESENVIEQFSAALDLRMIASQLLEEDRADEAVKPLRRAAEIYSQIKEEGCAAAAWRDVAFVFKHLHDEENENECVKNALAEGLFGHDPRTAALFVEGITRRALVAPQLLSGYRSLIRSAFLSIGPQYAYINAPQIVECMSTEERVLFAATVFDIFPIICADGWIYVYDREWSSIQGSEARRKWSARIPDDDQNSHLVRYVPVHSDVAGLKQELAKVG